MNPTDICRLAAKGDGDAERFLLSWATFAHTLDDAYDRDKPADDNALAAGFTAFILNLAGNAFFQQYKAQLVGLMVQSANYWVESNRRKGAERDILKAQWHSVVWATAHIKGGWQFMRHVTSEALEFDYEDRKEVG